MKKIVLSYSFFLLMLTLSSAHAVAAPLLEWQTSEGMKRLERSQAKLDFFPLANHFESQENKVFCGMASSAMVLNALRLDKSAIRKPQDHSLAPEDGKYLPKNVNLEFKRYTQQNIFTNAAKSKAEILGKPVLIQGKTVPDYGLQLRQLATLLKAHGLEVKTRVAIDALTDDTIRKELIQNMQTADDYVLVNYSRKILEQAGTGHISPLGAYDKISDSFLIMDVNPNAAKWVWVKTVDLIKAMRTFDTLENRGYLLVKDGTRKQGNN